MSEQHATFKISIDAFSSGQVLSKIWLCEELEAALHSKNFFKPLTIWIYGGWEGVLSLLLLTRNQLPIGRIRSFDLSAESTRRANLLLEAWVYQNWKFHAFTKDCNTLNPLGDLSDLASDYPDLIINTSVEHFQSSDWWNLVPSGTLVALQSSPNPHENEDTHSCEDLQEFAQRFPFSSTLFEGEKKITYENWELQRLMRIGYKF